MTVVQDRPDSGLASGEVPAERRTMIACQLRVSGVNTPSILEAFAATAREDFVPADRRAVAYADRAIPLGDGRVLAPALTYGQMLEAAAPVRADSVLVISANGYLAALAAHLSGAVARADSLAEAAGGPYSLILIDGAAEVLPDSLGAFLADDGRIITGLLDRGVTRLAVARKTMGKIVATPLSDADFAPLAEFAAPKTWSF